MPRTRLGRVVAATITLSLAVLGLTGLSEQAQAAPAVTNGNLSGTFLSGITGQPIAGTLWVGTIEGNEVRAEDIPAGPFNWTLAPGTYRVEFNTQEAGLISPFYFGETTRFDDAATTTVKAGTTTALGGVTVPKGATIAGHILGQLPTFPRSEAPILVYDEGDKVAGWAWWGTGGVYRSSGLYPGTYRVGVKIENFDDSYYDGASTLAAATPVVIGAAEAVTGIDIAPRPYSIISGTVTRPGAPNSFVTVRLASEDGTYSTSQGAYVQPDGSWSMPAAPGRHRVLFEPYGGMGVRGFAAQWWGGVPFPQQSPVIEVGQTDVTGIDATLAPGGLINIGTYVMSHPELQSHIRLAVLAKNPDGQWQVISGTTASRMTDIGYFVTGMMPGEYVVRVSDSTPDPAFPPVFFRDSPTPDGALVQTVTTTSSGTALIQVVTLPVPVVQPRPWTRDLNGDDAADILYRDSLGHLMIYAGNGTGGFAGKVQFGGSWGGFTAVIHAGDFTDDGIADVIARSSAGYLYLYRGNGTGSLTRSTISTSSFWKSQTLIISPGDFDGDGFTDLVSRDSSGYLWLHRGNGSGGIASKVKIGSAGWKAFTAVFPVSDFNGDGFPDIAARDIWDMLWIYPGNGTGGFKPRELAGTGWGSMTALRGVGDFNGDGHPDVIARDANGYLWLYKGNGTGKFAGKVKIGSSGWKAFRLAS